MVITFHSFLEPVPHIPFTDQWSLVCVSVSPFQDSKSIFDCSYRYLMRPSATRVIAWKTRQNPKEPFDNEHTANSDQCITHINHYIIPSCDVSNSYSERQYDNTCESLYGIVHSRIRCRYPTCNTTTKCGPSTTDDSSTLKIIYVAKRCILAFIFSAIKQCIDWKHQSNK